MSRSTTNVPTTFPIYRFSGGHAAIGEQFGEACADRIHHHLDLAQNRLEQKQGIARATAQANAGKFRSYVLQYAPFFDEEIQGLAKGAKISLEEAYLLQLRAELGVVPAEKLKEEPGDECTSYAVLAEATSDGIAMVGQNADLPGFYGELGIVVEMEFDDMPSILMLTPAGQVSYLGINDRGMGVFANYLTCDGWRVGFPRYFLSRLALTKESVGDAVAAIRGTYRASSRNLMLMDSQTAVDLETTATRDAEIHPERGMIAHANHYDHRDLLAEERAPAAYIGNTRTRGQTMRRLLDQHHGELNPEVMQTILRDRSTFPDCLCRVDADNLSHDSMTFASIIAQPSEGRMMIAVGPPHEHEYEGYSFSRVATPA
ncbi:MAG: C45 family autoproteolytic acyltransferase/hydrolase [Thermomicrobiales bacterium]